MNISSSGCHHSVSTFCSRGWSFVSNCRLPQFVLLSFFKKKCISAFWLNDKNQENIMWSCCEVFAIQPLFLSIVVCCGRWLAPSPWWCPYSFVVPFDAICGQCSSWLDREMFTVTRQTEQCNSLIKFLLTFMFTQKLLSEKESVVLPVLWVLYFFLSFSKREKSD